MRDILCDLTQPPELERLCLANDLVPPCVLKGLWDQWLLSNLFASPAEELFRFLVVGKMGIACARAVDCGPPSAQMGLIASRNQGFEEGSLVLGLERIDSGMSKALVSKDGFKKLRFIDICEGDANSPG